YSQIWLKLIKSISRSAQINQFEFQKSIHYPDQEMQFVLFTDEKQPGVMVSNRSKATDVYLLQSLIDQSNWSGKFWPAGSGWHRFSSQIDTLNYRDIYVYPKQTWQSHQVAENRQSNQNQSVAITGSAQIKENVEIERIWFYLLTFILFLLLWLEEKF
ncbi:MAG: hypothetical protein KDD94_10005, partial [Calditrichaeota bacterium]|nr:hypothetical protein [Calditrichota bacterium]